MPDNRKERSCFIIGPMRDSELGTRARLIKLAREVVRPLLEEIERREVVRYRVTTPYDLGGNHVMNDVIYAIDRADMVIADLTDSNPNVFYELGITHALGRACITVMEERQPKIEFDISAYRVYRLNLDDDQYMEAQRRLRDPLEKAHRTISDWSKFENPVIDFFRAPITYISPSYSLAQGYYLNFVRPVVESIIKRRGARYLYDIGIAPEGMSAPNKIEEAAVLDDSQRAALEMLVIIPTRISFTRHQYVDRLRGQLQAAVVEGDGRNYTSFYRVDGQKLFLIDVPTTLRVLEDAVDRRMRHPNVRSDDPEWREVEQQELDRVAVILQMLIDRHEQNPEFHDHVRIVRYDPDSPADLLWYHNLMQSRR